MTGEDGVDSVFGFFAVVSNGRVICAVFLQQLLVVPGEGRVESAVVPDENNSSAGLEDPCELWATAVDVEPVERLCREDPV